jgi:transposase, IS30 family
MSHLKLSQRIEIYTLLKHHRSLRSIALQLNCHVSTISRELKRNTGKNEIYSALTAQARTVSRCTLQRTKAPLKNLEIFIYVREHLRPPYLWSPEQIAGRISLDHPHLTISHETIYQYIYGKGKKFNLEEYLVRSHKKRRVKTGRSMKRSKSCIPYAVMIDCRSTKVSNRTQIGHWESDLMEGARNTDIRTVLCVSVERVSRYTLMSKLPSKHAKIKQIVLENKLKTLQSLEKSNKPIVRSITSDNGRENTYHVETSKQLNTKWYFTHPYHSWEKGTVENTIGRVRRYIPKGADVTQSDADIQALETHMNTTPRKCLGFQTPEEVFTKHVNIYKYNRYKLSKYQSVAFES